jgi:N-acetylneuraminic acid mutarotase
VNESSQLLRYDPVANRWTTLTAAPTPFAAATAVYSPINKKLYVFGGVHGQTAATSTAATDTRIYDLASNSWAGGAPLPEARVLMAAGYWNGKIYLVGGAASLSTPSVRDTTWEYDPIANTWSTLAPRPASGSGFSFGVIAGHLYLAGGYSPATGRFTTATYDYDIAADKWTVRASLPIAVNYAGSATLGGRLYVIAGIDNGAVEQHKTYVYDPASDTWSNGPDMTQARLLPATVSVGNTIVALGGSLSSIMLNSTEVATASCLASPTTHPPVPTQTP